MVPARSRRRRPTCWFPRTRGDGPTNLTALLRGMRVPPHSRGWSPRASVGSKAAPVPPHLRGRSRHGLPGWRCNGGSPALAGMPPHIVRRPQRPTASQLVAHVPHTLNMHYEDRSTFPRGLGPCLLQHSTGTRSGGTALVACRRVYAETNVSSATMSDTLGQPTPSSACFGVRLQPTMADFSAVCPCR